jgi:hypothetical protein
MAQVPILAHPTMWNFVSIPLLIGNVVVFLLVGGKGQNSGCTVVSRVGFLEVVIHMKRNPFGFADSLEVGSSIV